MINDDIIRLRALEPEDLECLYQWENDMDLWGLVDKNGKVIIPCSYVSAQVFNGKVVLLCDKNSQWSIRNLNGKLIKKLSKEYGTTVKQELSFISLFGILGLSDFGGEV